MSLVSAVPAERVFVVSRGAAGSRLDQFVARAMSGEDDAPSRAEVKRWIDEGRVTVDGSARKASDKVTVAAEVLVRRSPPRTTRALPEAGVAFEVLYVDDDLVVVNKPPGLVVHPARGHEGGTLVNGLLARGLFDVGELASAGGDADAHVRPGIVHRIDKGTSGILVVARTARAREHLKAQLALHTMLREYEALCVGDVTLMRHDTLHGRHPRDRLRFTSRVSSGKRAVTHVRVLERFERRTSPGRATRVASHVACTLETGRTHQIRVHLAESGTPILGDALYGKPPKDERLRAIAKELGHQALHARLLGFSHPRSGKAMRFEAPAPPDFLSALAALREYARAP